MAKLNQIIAIANGKKSRAQAVLTEVHHKVGKSDLLSGLSRTYRPKDDDGEKLPGESKKRQYSVEEAMATVRDTLTDLWDTIATQDNGNTEAKADVVVDGFVVAHEVPVTTLLFLEKQLVDLHTFFSKLPVLDPSETWKYVESQACYATEPTETVRTKKVPRAFEASPATKEHPAQVQVFHEDVVAGYWTQVKFSGAISQEQKNSIVTRVERLQDAVKRAREEANSIVVGDTFIGTQIFRYITG